MTQVTYVPQDNGDPITSAFAGFSFRAGEPIDIPDDAKVLQTIIKESGKGPEGDIHYRGVDMMVPVVEVLKKNRYFRVEGAAVPPPSKPGRKPMPKTPDEYRGYAMEWINRHGDEKSQSHLTLAQRWEDERSLREKLSVHDEGEIVLYIRQFYEAKFHELKRAAV